ncbi:lymphocyte cytosolic protein 2 [Dendropsophus ebraccatus]|uniref:lymphocyte cytosolic protein 2 n=1 Tax=Dendropsophus ebraccatus TaxID=150705 RepID=UPI00383202CB
MDFRKMPSCTEVSKWSPDDLIDYFRMCNLKDCEKLVKKQGIDGRRFLDMSEIDMQKFPKTRVPMLIRIQQEIKKEKKGFFPRLDTQRGHPSGKMQMSYPPTSHDVDMSESWDGSGSDSFEDDDDYVDPDASDVEDYESPAQEDEDSGNSDGYEPPPSNNNILPINAPKTNSSNPDYIDRPMASNSVRGPPNPPKRPEVAAFTSRGNTFPGVPTSSGQNSPTLSKPKSLAPSVDRTTKPNSQANPGKLPSTSGKNLSGHTKAITLPANIRPSAKPEHLRKPALPSQSPAIRSSYSSHIPDSEDVPTVSTLFVVNFRTFYTENNMSDENVPPLIIIASWRLHPHQSNTFPSTSPKPSIRSMGSGSNTLPSTDIGGPLPGGIPFPPYKPDNRYTDAPQNGRPPAPIPVTNATHTSIPGSEAIYSEQWYLGSISRRDAEKALRSVNMDGTFLVRNCSQSTLTQPYVLMVLYKNKVYNVRIRYDQNNQVYLLGSGGHETFDSVTEIIDFFRKNPLLLIDGKDRGSRQHGKLTCIADRSFL